VITQYIILFVDEYSRYQDKFAPNHSSWKPYSSAINSYSARESDPPVVHSHHSHVTWKPNPHPLLSPPPPFHSSPTSLETSQLSQHPPNPVPQLCQYLSIYLSIYLCGQEIVSTVLYFVLALLGTITQIPEVAHTCMPSLLGNKILYW
jgi:hypothetical protein